MKDMNILKPFLGASLIVSVMALTACDQPKKNEAGSADKTEQQTTNLEKAEGVKQKVEANFAYKRAKARFQVVKVVNKFS